MVFRHGRRTRILFQGNDVTTYLNEAGSTSSIETAEVTSFAADTKAYIIGNRDGTLSLSGMFDGATDAVDEIFETAAFAEDGSHVMIMQASEASDAVGATCQFAKGDMTSYEVSSPMSDVAAVSVEVQADGGLYSGVVLHDPNASGVAVYNANVDDNETSVDDSSSSSGGALGHLQVIANTLNGSAVVTIEDSSDNSAFASLIGFTAVSAGNTTAENVEVSGTVDRYVRLNVDTTAASTGSITLAVGFYRQAATS